MDSITVQIQRLLAQVEQAENVRLLFSCESGSRAWGFESIDSDYDVRFVYVRPKDWYLSIDEGRDVIERPIDDNIDLSGWDIRKALRLLRKSNPPLLEWLQSPIVYQENAKIAGWLREEVPKAYSKVSCIYHYLNMAQRNFRHYLQSDLVKVKKYFYVLRPVLACLWIEQGRGPVPMEFDRLFEVLVSSGPLRDAIAELLIRKKAGEELDLEPAIPVLNLFLSTELERLAGSIDYKNESSIRTKELNDLFRKILNEAWT